MASKYVFIFIAISQALAQTTFNSKSSSSSSSSSSTSSSAIVQTVQQLLDNQILLQSTIKQQSDYVRRAQDIYEKQNWSMVSTDLKSTIEQSILATQEIIKKASNYCQGANKFLSVLRSAGLDIKPEWVERVKKLQELGNIASLRANVGTEAIIKQCAEIEAEQQVAADAKIQQLTETKKQMDLALEQLSQQMLQVGINAAEALQPEIENFKSVLGSYTKEGSAFTRLAGAMAPLENDLKNLKPEDINMAFSHTRKAMDDANTVLTSYGVPPREAKPMINSALLKMDAWLTRAKNMHN